MATIVALRKGKPVSIPPDEFHNVDLVDGQQRVTTLVILLKAIEQALPDGQWLNAKLGLQNLLVKSDDQALVLLQTNHDSTGIFSTYLRKGKLEEASAKIASDKNLADAIKECEAFVKQWSKEKDLISLLDIIHNKLSVIYHELDNASTVYRVFEVLNSRGLDVKWLDKTKSRLMESIFKYAQKSARDGALKEMYGIWKKIYQTLGLDEGLGDEALCFTGTWHRADGPYKSKISAESLASDDLLRSANTLPKIRRVAEKLLKVVGYVSALSKNKRLAAVVKIKQARFVYIAIKMREFPPNKEQKLLAVWERVTFRIYGLGDADARTGVGGYANLGYNVVNKKLTPNKIETELNNLGKGYEIDNIINDDTWFDWYPSWKEETRYLLCRYEEHLAKQAGAAINHTEWNKIWEKDPSTSIEHILPQSTKKGGNFIHHLGNLTMLPPGMNSALKDMPPTEKAVRYIENSGHRQAIAVGKTIDRLGKWNSADIKARAKIIESFVKKEWGG